MLFFCGQISRNLRFHSDPLDPDLFYHGFHGCDLDKTNTKWVNGSDPNLMVGEFGFCIRVNPCHPWLKIFFAFIAPRVPSFLKQRLTCPPAVHWFPLLSITGW